MAEENDSDDMIGRCASARTPRGCLRKIQHLVKTHASDSDAATHDGAAVAQFSVERTKDGRTVFFRLHDDVGCIVLTSTSLRTQDFAASVIESLKASIPNDWMYLVTARHRNPIFSIAVAKTTVVCTSPGYSSCDAMERAIETLKAIAIHAPIAYITDKPIAECAQPHPDGPQRHLHAQESGSSRVPSVTARPSTSA